MAAGAHRRARRIPVHHDDADRHLAPYRQVPFRARNRAAQAVRHLDLACGLRGGPGGDGGGVSPPNPRGPRRDSGKTQPDARSGEVLLRAPLQGALLFALGIALFAAPAATKHFWPWALSALTAPAVGAWLLGIGVLMFHMALEGDLRRARNAATALLTSCLLEFVALARLGADTDATGMPVIHWNGHANWVLRATLAWISGAAGYTVITSRQ